MLLSLNDIADWLQAHSLACPVKKYLHFDCPGCGIQRSFVELLKGNFVLSFQYHPATVPLILFLLYAIFHLVFKFKQGNKAIIYGYLFVVCIVITNYIYKLINQTLTNLN